MIYDIQNAALGKRLSAWLLDFILLVVLITGVAALVSGAMDYDSHSAKLDAIYESTKKNTELTSPNLQNSSRKPMRLPARLSARMRRLQPHQ